MKESPMRVLRLTTEDAKTWSQVCAGTPAWVLLGQADDQLLQLLVEWGVSRFRGAGKSRRRRPAAGASAAASPA